MVWLPVLCMRSVSTLNCLYTEFYSGFKWNDLAATIDKGITLFNNCTLECI